MTNTQVFAERITKENVDRIIEIVAKHELNVDYLHDNLEIATKDGVWIYGILCVYLDAEIMPDATFTELERTDFDSYWRFAGDGVNHHELRHVVKI